MGQQAPTIGLQRWLILPDAHLPYHNKKALEDLIFQEVVPRFDFHGVVILGDWFDNYAVSDYTKSPTRLGNLKQEMKAGRDALHFLESMPFKERIFIEGNHENRFSRFLSKNAPELYEWATDMWMSIFGAWKYVPYREDIEIGKLFATHDIGHSGKHSTRQTLEAYQDNMVMGHNHTMDFHVQGNAKGIPHVGASFGWLGDADQIDYKHRMKAKKDWVLGFGTGYVNPENGFIYLTPHPIVEYTAVVDGYLFKAR